MKTNNQFLQLYTKYYIEREYEQTDLFRMLRQTYTISRVIYPGSYLHIAPSFVFPDVVYIDAGTRAQRAFDLDTVHAYICQRKEYHDVPHIAFYGRDYRQLIPTLVQSCDLLISQYAGFVSDVCKPYLKPGGWLLVNNSHADAGLAAIDPAYQLVATVHKRQGHYRLSQHTLDQYFIPKRALHITKEWLYQRGKGIGYTKTAPLYLFQRRMEVS